MTAGHGRCRGHLAADAIVVLDGGIGTLSEATTACAALQTEPQTPDLVFFGGSWRPVLEAVAAHLVIDDRDLARVTTCASAADRRTATAGRRRAARAR